MPAVPEQLLAAPVTSTARVVLTALWGRAVVDTVAFVAMRVRELAKVLDKPWPTVRDAVAELRAAELIQPSKRRFAGTELKGFELSRVVLRQKVRKAVLATPAVRTSSVAVREETPRKPTEADDFAAIGRVAVRGDSEMAIARKLFRAKWAPPGHWQRLVDGEFAPHNIKVHRRIDAMKRDLGITESLRAGEVVHRWKMVKETG
jgi:hypothetical protein